MTARDALTAAARAGLGLVRRGPRTVHLVSPEVNFGNFCYVWLRAYTRQAQGQDYRVEHTPRMDYWLDYLPYVRDRLLIERSEMGFFDRRELGAAQGWGSDYLPFQVPPFVSDVLLDSGLGLAAADEPVGRVVVNVRRGDFFSERFAARYSYDTVAYLRAALDRAVTRGGPITEAVVVSDDPAWCRTHLPAVFGDVPLAFPKADRTPLDDFRTLAGARRLILTTSTFGYWGAHVSNALHGDNHELVVAPWFHDRSVWAGESYMLNPAWTVVRNVPGGWGPEPPTGP